MCTSHSSLQLYLLRKMLFLVFFLSMFLGSEQVFGTPVEIAKWDFNSSLDSTQGKTALLSNLSTSGIATGGTNCSTGGITCWYTKDWPSSGNIDFTKYLQFPINTSGYNNISIQIVQKKASGSSYPTTYDVYYSTDNCVTMNSSALNTLSISTGYTANSVSGSVLDNQGNACLRLIAYGKPSGTPSSVLWQIDSLTVAGDAIPTTVAPSISVPPASTTIVSGSSATLNVTAAGIPSPSYQWYEGAAGVTTTPVGTNSASFTTPTLTVTKSYWVRITNGVSPDVDSSTATVTVNVPPTISTHPLNQSIVSGGTATLSVSASSIAGTLSYQWYQGSSGDTTNSISGATSNSYTTPNLSTATSYWVRVTNTLNSTTTQTDSNTATVSVTASATAPSISTQPADTSITSGSTATLNVVASGTAPLTYQWYQGNAGDTSTLATGATAITASYTTPSLSTTTKYWVKVSNTAGNSSSNAATVTVTAAPPTISTHPSSISIVSGDTTTLTVVATGSPTIYQWYQGTAGVTTTPVGTNSASFTTPNLTTTTSYWVRVTNSGGNVDSNVATITVTPAPPVITVQPADKSVLSGGSATFTVTATGTSLSYQWYQGSGTGSPISGATSSSYTTPALTSSTSYWVRVSNSAGNADSNVVTATITASVVAPTIATHPQSTTITSGNTSALGVSASGTAPFTYQWYQGSGSSSPISGATSASYTTPTLTVTTSYWVRVTNSAGSADSNLATITVAAAASAPSITVQPSNVSITSGSTATLSVSATGNPSPSYQWYQGSTAISGATSSSYTTPALTSSTSYWVKVSNSLGTMDSSTATVTVNAVVPPPPPPATFGLGLKKDGTGSGKVFSDTGMECGNYCTDEFDSSKTVTLSATPDLGSVFAKFTCSSGETSSQPSLSVRMNAVKICTATFNQVPKYKLSVSTQGKATGTVTTQPTAISACGTGCFEFYEGTAVTLVPQPATGAAFTEWSSNCPDGKITVKNAGNSCTATFMPLYTLTVATAGTGLGSVTSAPTGIECGNGKTSCAKIYGEGVSVTLTPTASAGFAFAGWNPECADGKVTLTSNKTCTASFMPIFTLKVAVAGAPSGKITSDPAGIECGTVCSTTVAAGNKIALIPTASQLGVTFTGWSGDCVSSNVVTMDKDKQCTANFANTGTTQFSSKAFEIKEDGKHAVITVQRVSGATGALTSYYTTADGTAKADGDYTPTTGTLEWKDGETADKTFTVPINFDNDIEGNETLAVRLLNSSGGVRDEAVLTIVDVVVPNALQFSHPVARINEADGKVRLTVVRAANSAGKVTVDYATQDKDAVAGQDYVEQKGTLTWESGDMERKFIEIPILDNPNKNVNTQFQVVLSNPQPATIAVLGPNKYVTVSIVNTATSTVAGGSIEFSSNHYDVNESRGNIEILLKRLGSKVGTVSVLFATQDGSAVQDVDYIAKQQTVEWTDGDDSDKSIILTIPYNAQPEADKVLNLTLANPSAGANLGAIDKATLRIIDSYASSTTVEPEKPQHGVIQLGANAYQAEEGSLVALKVSRVGGNQDPVTVKYMTSNGTAKTGEDYVGRLGELTWLDKESGDKFISINLLDNTVRDSDRSFTVQLFPVNNSAVSNDTATVLIKDNDNTTVQFTAASFNALENAGEATITVSRQQGSVGNVTVYYQLQEETAKAGTDFALASGRLLWLDGDTADKSFGVKLYDNATFNGNRSLKVSLHTPEGASLGVPSSATLTIQEDDSSVQPECQPKSSSVECGLDNTGKTLENVKISATGTVQGGTLAGKIENLGTVRDVTLQPGTQLIGGNVGGTISGVNSTQLARLIAVKIAAATLRYVVIDAQSVLADDVVLGEGVLFESNATIPAVSLAQTLGSIAPPFNMITPFAAIRLNQDVLFNSISGGIVTAINELSDLKSWGMKLQQNPTTGYLETTLGNTYYAVMPIEVRHVLRHLLNGQMQSGVYMAADGSITFITYTGRWVRTVPVLHDSQAFLVGLNGFGLTQFSVFPNGNFRVPVADTGIYYSARPNVFATRIQTRENVNLDVLRMPIVVNYGDGWQQSLYPAAAQPEAIYTLSPEAVLEQDGRLILKLGTGDTQRTFYGIFDYVVTPGAATQQGDSLFYQIEDKNGDGMPDYRIVYPNGDGQLIFAR